METRMLRLLGSAELVAHDFVCGKKPSGFGWAWSEIQRGWCRRQAPLVDENPDLPTFLIRG